MLDVQMSFNGDISPEAVLSLFGLQDHGAVQEAVDRAVIEYMNPYWAYDTGALVNSAYTASDIGGGQIVYDTPYAWEMYYGTRRDGTPFNYHTEKHPLAGAFPFDRMIGDHFEDILEEARNVARNQQH